jgi:membrane-bound lytic murein transglycosylase D
VNPGDELVIPESIAVAAPRAVHYVTRAGDTLVTIADRFNISVEDLRRWNHLSSSTIKPHRTLDVAQPVHLAPATRVRGNAHGHSSTKVSMTSASKAHGRASSKSAPSKNSSRSKRHTASR